MNPRLAKVLEKHADAGEDRKAHAKRKRDMFPGVASCIDEVTAIFGPVKAVPYGRESDGRFFGEPGPAPDEIAVEPVIAPKGENVEPVRVRKPAKSEGAWWVEGGDE